MSHDEKIKTYVHSDNICLAAYHWGELTPEKESIIFIHGYPDSAEVWNKLAESLADEFNVIAYDVRGTGLSDIPAHSSEYDFKYLINDLEQVIQAFSPHQPVHLVGHDWGALQGWEVVLGDRLKDKIQSYTALAPSLDHVGWWFKREWSKGSFQGYRNVIQRGISSGYMGIFQIPWIPELVWNLGLAQLWPKWVAKSENTEVQPDPKQLRNGVNGLGLYRQNLIQALSHPTSRTTSIPIHMLVMTQDPFVPKHLSLGMGEWASDIHYTQIESGHWGILSHYAEISKKIRDYIQQLNS